MISICKRIMGGVRIILLTVRRILLNRIYGTHISKKAIISWGAKLDKTYPQGIYIDDDSFVASGAIILTHDFCRALHEKTHIGKKCFIGVNAIVMCGVTIGDEVVVGSGAIVTKDIPSNCIVAGNPAHIIHRGIKTKKSGQITERHSILKG